MFSPKYHLYSKTTNNHIMSARREAISILSSYVISTDKEQFSTKKSSFIGRVQSDILEETYFIYDNGIDPSYT